MIDNTGTFLRTILGSFWGRLFQSSWVYKAVLKFIGALSRAALFKSQKYEDSRTIKEASSRYPVIKYLQVPLKSIHSGTLVLDGSWTVGSAVLGQTVTTDKTIVQISLPENCEALSSEYNGKNLWIKDVDFFVGNNYFVLIGDAAKLFTYVYMDNGEPYFDLWLYGTTTEASLDDFSVITNTDLNQIPEAGASVWDGYINGLDIDVLNRIICNGLGADRAFIGGSVRRVWTEGHTSYVDVGGMIHKASIQYPALVRPGDVVEPHQQLFDTHTLYTGGTLPDFFDVPEIVLPAGPGRFVRIPNYMVPVKSYAGIKYLELTTTVGSFEESVHDVIANYEVLSICDTETSVNALQYVMEKVFNRSLCILKLKHITEDQSTAIMALAQAVHSLRPMYACIAVAVSGEAESSGVLHISVGQNSTGNGNAGSDTAHPEAGAVDLICGVGTNKVSFE